MMLSGSVKGKRWAARASYRSSPSAGVAAPVWRQGTQDGQGGPARPSHAGAGAPMGRGTGPAQGAHPGSPAPLRVQARACSRRPGARRPRRLGRRRPLQPLAGWLYQRCGRARALPSRAPAGPASSLLGRPCVGCCVRASKAGVRSPLAPWAEAHCRWRPRLPRTTRRCCRRCRPQSRCHRTRPHHRLTPAHAHAGARGPALHARAACPRPERPPAAGRAARAGYPAAPLPCAPLQQQVPPPWARAAGRPARALPRACMSPAMVPCMLAPCRCGHAWLREARPLPACPACLRISARYGPGRATVALEAELYSVRFQ